MSKQAMVSLAQHLGLELEYKGFSMVRVIGEQKWYCGYAQMYNHLYNKKRRKDYNPLQDVAAST